MTEVGLLGTLGNILEQGPVSKRMAPELDQAGQQIPAPAGVFSKHSHIKPTVDRMCCSHFSVGPATGR